MKVKALKVDKDYYRFYVYFHTRKDTGEVAYIGKGNGKRAWWFFGRNEYWENVNNKHGLEVKIAIAGLTEEKAFEHEIALIKHYTKIGARLTNLTCGGEGVSGNTPTEDTRRKQALAKTGARNVLYGKARDKSIIEKIAASNKGKKRSQATIAKQKAIWANKTEEEKRILLEHTVGIKNPAADKRIYNFIHKNGETYTGTRLGLCKKYSVKRQNLNTLFRKDNPNKTACGGWSVSTVVEENIGE